jgi:hypothetical protein
MDFDRVNKWLTLVANFGVVVGLVFLALEMKTTTDTNRIAIQQGYSTNWLLINSQVAGDGELASIIEKVYSGLELTPVEERRMRRFIRMRVSHALSMLRLYDSGVIPRDEATEAIGPIRASARNQHYRRILEAVLWSDRLRGLILEEDGLEKWVDLQN